MHLDDDRSYSKSKSSRKPFPDIFTIKVNVVELINSLDYHSLGLAVRFTWCRRHWSDYSHAMTYVRPYLFIHAYGSCHYYYNITTT